MSGILRLGVGDNRLSYLEKVLSVAPGSLIGYWPMSEGSGASVSVDFSPEGNDGAYTNGELGQLGIGDGRTSMLFDNDDSFNNIYSAALNTDFDGKEGGLLAWGALPNTGVWADGTARMLVELRADVNNYVQLNRSTVDNRLEWRYVAGGTFKSTSETSFGPSLDFFTMLLTWSDTDDKAIAYMNGSQLAELTGIGTWVGALDSTLTVIGALNTAAAAPWSGRGAHVALWAGSDVPALLQAAAAILAQV